MPGGPGAPPGVRMAGCGPSQAGVLPGQVCMALLDDLDHALISLRELVGAIDTDDERRRQAGVYRDEIGRAHV